MYFDAFCLWSMLRLRNIFIVQIECLKQLQKALWTVLPESLSVDIYR